MILVNIFYLEPFEPLKLHKIVKNTPLRGGGGGNARFRYLDLPGFNVHIDTHPYTNWDIKIHFIHLISKHLSIIVILFIFIAKT